MIETVQTNPSSTSNMDVTTIGNTHPEIDINIEAI